MFVSTRQSQHCLKSSLSLLLPSLYGPLPHRHLTPNSGIYVAERYYIYFFFFISMFLWKLQHKHIFFFFFFTNIFFCVYVALRAPTIVCINIPCLCRSRLKIAGTPHRGWGEAGGIARNDKTRIEWILLLLPFLPRSHRFRGPFCRSSACARTPGQAPLSHCFWIKWIVQWRITISLLKVHTHTA